MQARSTFSEEPGGIQVGGLKETEWEGCRKGDALVGAPAMVPGQALIRGLPKRPVPCRRFRPSKKGIPGGKLIYPASYRFAAVVLNVSSILELRFSERPFCNQPSLEIPQAKA